MASSPYKSEVLRFFIRQTHRIKANAAQVWRWTKVTTVWSAQAIGVTAYGLWRLAKQGGRLTQPIFRASASQFGKLTGRVRQSFLAPRIATDTPIRRVLKAAQAKDSLHPLGDMQQPAEAFVVKGETRTSQLLPSFKAGVLSWLAHLLPGRLQLQTLQLPDQSSDLPAVSKPVEGVASDLATGRLAWVTANDIAVLDETTHTQLQQVIVSELAVYDRQMCQLQRRQQFVRWSGYQMAQVKAWIWQAIVYFFGGSNRQNPALSNGQQQSTLTRRNGTDPSGRPWIKDIVQQGQVIRQHWSLVENLKIHSWIRQAFTYFFGKQNTYSLEAGKTALAPVGNASLSMVLVPGLVEFGQAISSWIKRTLARWFPGSSLTVREESRDTSSAVTEQATILPLRPSFLGREQVSMLPSIPSGFCSDRIQGQPMLIGASGATLTMPFSADMSTTWVEVPATLVGYGRSPLVWILTGLDWLLVKLEQLPLWLWQHLKMLIRVIRWYLFSHRWPTVHLFAVLPTGNQDQAEP
jgi:hypothetical protein